MFEDKIEAMNKLPNAVDDSSGFEKRVYTVRTVQMKTPPCSQNCYQIRKQQHY